MKVVTYESPRGGSINLTPAQVTLLEHCERWPKDDAGVEYARVSHGLHEGAPTYTDEAIAAFLVRGELPERVDE